MTDDLDVPTSLRTVWVFRVDLPQEALEGFQEEGESGTTPIAEAVGAGPLDPDYYELFDAASILDYGMAAYLTEANGMNPDDVGPDAETLDALTGPVLLLFDAALPEGTARIAPSAPLTLVGRYEEKPRFSVAPPLQSEAAAGVIGDAPADAPQPGRPGSIASLVLVAVIVLAGLLIWAALR